MDQKILFTEVLLRFLKRQGYTHMQLLGIQQRTEQYPEQMNRDHFLLKPWKRGIGLFEDANMQLEEIGSTDISDMLEVEFGIHFWVELPEKLAKDYQAYSSTKS